MSSSYSGLFTHSYPVVMGSSKPIFMEHKDGAVSCAVKWSGIDFESVGSDSDLATVMASMYQFFAAAARHTDLYLEHHLFRGIDTYWTQKFYEYGINNFKPDRNPEFASKVRMELANHYAKYSRHNDIYLVFLLKPSFGFFSGKSKKAIEDRSINLSKIVNELTSYLPGPIDILDIDGYNSLILRHNSPARVKTGREICPYNYRFSASDMLVKPTIDHRCVRTSGPDGSYFHRVIAFLDYPDAMQGWPSYLSRNNSDNIHVVQITNALNAQAVTSQSVRDQERSSEAANMVGGEDVAAKIGELSGFRDFVQQHNLSIHANCYLIVISDISVDAVNERHKSVCDWIYSSSPGAKIVTDDPEIELHYFRISTPGMGYLSPYMRADHHWQVANMTPCFAQSHGDMENPEMAYLTSIGTMVGIRQRPNALHHSLCAAKTGSGKTVTMLSMVAMLYPLGFNFYITEVGRCYEFIVRAYGGEYHALDPDSSVVSPLASYSEMGMLKKSASSVPDPDSDSQAPVSVAAITTMQKSLMPILLATSDVSSYEGIVHCEAALSEVIEFLYSEEMRVDGLSGPTLETVLDVGKLYLEYIEELNDHRAPYLKVMMENLESFLLTAEGQVFRKGDTIDFTSSLIGLDFGALIHGNANNLAKYLLLFTTTRLQQLSFITPERTFLMFDEDHEYTNIDKKLMNLTKSQITKRGRKHGAFLLPISQSVSDIAYSDDGSVNTDVVNQMSNFWLLYYGTEHEKLPELFNLSDRAKEIWTGYRDPLAPGIVMDYRQGLFVQSGNHYDLFFTWPEIMNALTNSNPDALELKGRLIEEEGGDMELAISRFIQEYEG